MTNTRKIRKTVLFHICKQAVSSDSDTAMLHKPAHYVLSTTQSFDRTHPWHYHSAELPVRKPVSANTGPQYSASVTDSDRMKTAPECFNSTQLSSCEEKRRQPILRTCWLEIRYCPGIPKTKRSRDIVFETKSKLLDV